MPRIPTYEARLGPPRGALSPRAPLNLTARPWQALEQAGAVLTREARDFGEALVRTREATALAEARVAARGDFTALEEGYLKRTDYQNIPADLQKDLDRIRKKYLDNAPGDAVRRRLAADLDEMALVTRAKVHGHAWRREVEEAVALYEQRLEALAHFYARPEGSERERQGIERIVEQITREAVDAGYLSPTQARAYRSRWNKKAQTALAMLEVHEDPEGADLDRFADLDETTRAGLKIQARNLATARAEAWVRRMEREQRRVEAQIRRMQEETATDLTVRAVEGRLDEEELRRAVDRRMLRLEDYNAIRKILEQEQEPPKHDDPMAATALLDGILQGTAGRKDVMQAVREGLITASTARKYIERVYQVAARPTVTRSQEYRDALSMIKVRTNLRSPWDPVDPQAALREQQAREEFFERVVVKGESIARAREDILARYGTPVRDPGALPRPLFGTRDDPQGAYRNTIRAWREGRIDQKTLLRELRNIRRILDLGAPRPVRRTQTGLPERGRSQAAPPAESGDKPPSAKDRVKERKSRW